MLGWLGKKTDTGWTAVDAAGDGLYGVSVLPPHTPGGKPRVLKCGAMPGAQLNAGALAGLAGKISVPGCPWTLPLERKAYTLLVVEEPNVQPGELEQSVRWSISSLIDYSADEANIAVMKIPTATLSPNRTAHIYVVAAKSEVVARYRDLFKQARISLQAIDVRETAQRNIAALAEKPGEGVGLLSIGKQGVHFTITFNGELYLDRFVEEPLLVDPLADVDAMGRAGERMVLQVQRSLDYIGRTLQFITIDRVLLAPMSGNSQLGDFIAQNIQVPVAELDLASLFDFSETPELARKENQVPYFFALGAALRFMKKTA
jgi:MSHA biogenesis protein MshI